MATIELRVLPTRIALNSIWLLAARLSGQGFMLIFTVLVTRHLGETGFGQYAFIAAVIFLGNALTTFGLDTLLMRDLAGTRRPDAALLTSAIWLQLAFSILFIAGLAVAAGFLKNKTPETILALKLYSLSLLPLAFFTAFSAALRAYERMDLFLALNLLSAAAQALSAGLALWNGGGLVSLITFLLISQVGGAVIAAGICARWLPGFSLTWRVSWTHGWQLAGRGWPLALVGLLRLSYQRLGLLLLSLLAGDAVTGRFAAAVRITDASEMLPYALLGALFPLMSRLAARPPAAGVTGQRLQRASLALMLAFGTLAAVSLTLLAAPLIHLLYGAAYQASAPALQILAWKLIPFAVTVQTFFQLVAAGRERQALWITSVSLVLAVTLYLVLIPALGLAGACLASVSSELIQALLYGSLAWARPASVLPARQRQNI